MYPTPSSPPIPRSHLPQRSTHLSHTSNSPSYTSYCSTRHYVSPTFTNQLVHHDRDSTTHTRKFEQPLGPDKCPTGHLYILIPQNITTNHRITLLRHREIYITHILAHDRCHNLFDLTAIDNRLQLLTKTTNSKHHSVPTPPNHSTT